MEQVKKHPLEGIKGTVNYFGCLVTPMIGKGYMIFGRYAETIEDVDKFISDAQKAIKNRIKTH